MKKGLAFISIIIIFSLGFMLYNHYNNSVLRDTIVDGGNEENGDVEIDHKKEMEAVVELTFVPQPVKPLKMLDGLDGDWRLVDSNVFFKVAEAHEISVNFYEIADGAGRLILQDENGFYDLGLDFLTAYPERVNITVEDTNGDGNHELMIAVDQGATVKHVKIYTFAGEKWSCLLDTENLITIDLSNDGHNQLVTTSMGSNPPFVYIYRWHKDHFQKSDVVADSNAYFATIVTINDKNFIEIGVIGESKTYEYKDGKLIEFVGN